MDESIMKKLNQQGLLIAFLHAFILLNLAFDFIFVT